MSQALTTVEHEITALAPQFAALLPPDVSPEKFREVVLTAIRQKPDLVFKCDRQSLFNACLNAAQDGLMPDGREGAIVPRKGKAVWQPMIQGIYKRVKTSGSVASISANVVYDGETFDVLLGDDDRIVHRRDMARVANGNEVAVYAIAVLKDGTKEREVMTWEQIMAVRQSSATPNDGPWVSWPDEMARKTVVRRLAKRLPVLDQADEALHRTIGRVDSLYAFGTPAPEAPQAPSSQRDALNAQIPLRPAAAATPRPERKVDPTPYEAGPPAPDRKSWAQWAQSLELADRDSKDTAAIGRIIAKSEVAEIVRLAQEGEPSPAKTRIVAAFRNLEARYLADPPQPPDADDLDEVVIAGEHNLAAG